ncbi:MAG: LysM peptidoglycan-binding domain-containing protein, partial [Paludibacter sp.]
TVYKTNRTKYIVAESGDTYESIAEEFNISIRKLKEYNEIDSNSGLKAGTQLYLRKKKNKASYGINNHVIKSGETMYSISQTYGIRLEKLYQLNNMPYTETARIGKVLKLR